MKLTIIAPEHFKQIPWKNGKGITTELAINAGDDLSDFDWRLSIATVSEDGPFSDFSGYLRNLILIEGNGIDLHHDDTKCDRLDKLLTFATFDGSSKTTGTLHNGTIKDFNLMTRFDKYHTSVQTWCDNQTNHLTLGDINFVYSLSNQCSIKAVDDTIEHSCADQHLMIIENTNKNTIELTGENLIFIRLDKK